MTSAAYHPNLGDVTIETTFSDYEDVDGLKLPAHLVTRLDRFTRDDLRFTTQTLDANAADTVAPETVRAAAAPPLVPPQNVTVEELGQGIWRLGGGSHHSVLFEFADHLTLFEVPQSEARARAVMARARELRPGKPLTHAIVSHHHFDHTAGVRAAVAEGLRIVTHERSAAALRELMERTHSAMPETLTQRPKPMVLEAMGDAQTLQDSALEVRLYHLSGNPHADTLIMAYVPRDRPADSGRRLRAGAAVHRIPVRAQPRGPYPEARAARGPARPDPQRREDARRVPDDRAGVDDEVARGPAEAGPYVQTGLLG